jgi:hypothetical protein
VATTASRVAKGRPTNGKPTIARHTPHRVSKLAPKTTTIPPKKASSPPSRSRPLAGLRNAITAAKQPGRLAKMMESVQSVQEAPSVSKPWPRWRKIALWAVMLTPVYAIVIYIVGGVYLASAGLNGIGVNTSFQTHVLKVVNGISVPDQNGTFLQTGTDPMQPLNLLMEYNDRGLQPPPNQQFTVASGNLRYLLIRQSAVSLPTDYQLFQIDHNNVDHLVKGVVARRVPVERIALISMAMPNGQTWAPGQYVIVIPDLDGSSFYYYFFAVTK